MSGQTNAWRCSVCGYLHRGPTPPDVCPVCGASRDKFEPYVEAPQPAAEAAATKWRCLICTYVHRGPAPPDVCPVCGAIADRFERIAPPADKAPESGRKANVVIVGAGIAGVAAAESIRQTSSEARITLVSQEAELPYYRLNLTRYLAGEIDAGRLPIHPESWYGEQEIRLMRGAEVSAIHPDDQAVTLSNGKNLSFGRLLLATGAHPFIPPLPGADQEGVTALRTLDDANRILEASREGATCVCIGGGLLGVETAAALARQGADVTLLESSGWLLPRQLNERAGRILGEHVQRTGIRLRTGAVVREIHGRRRVGRVLLDDDTELAADLVVIATGIRAETRLAQEAGLDVNRGVLVDDTLETSQPNVFAAGDVAEHRGVMYGIWGPAQYQGTIAGMNMLGIRTEFAGIPPSHTLKVLGLDLFSIGQIAEERAASHAVDQEIDGRYVHFAFRDSRLIGAILLEKTELAARVKKAVEDQEDFSALLSKRPDAQDVMHCLEQ
jgi:nitrite reductase (NADH) large subunit